MTHLSKTGVIKPTKLIIKKKQKKQVNKFIEVKIVLILNFRDWKVIFAVFMSKM